MDYNIHALLLDLSRATGETVLYHADTDPGVAVARPDTGVLTILPQRSGDGAPPGAPETLPCPFSHNPGRCARCLFPLPELPVGRLCCRARQAFLYRELRSGGARRGALVMGPLPAGDAARLNALEATLEAFACLARERGMIQSHNRTFEELSAYVSQHLSEPLTIPALEAALFASADALSRAAKQQTGMPLRRYIQSRRLDAACAMLLTSSMSILEVAERCGINDFNYFSRIFKRRYGKTPSEMRALGLPSPHSLQIPTENL